MTETSGLPIWLNGYDPESAALILAALAEASADLRDVGSLSESDRVEFLAQVLAASVADAETAGGSAEYDAARNYAAEKSRERSKAGREIGELPAVADPARRAAAMADPRFFLETYFAPAFRLGWCSDHLVLIEETARVIRDGGFRAVGMPRGTGKTTIVVRLLVWAVCCGLHPFVMVVAANAGKAEAALRDIVVIFSHNDLLAADFPEICFPFRALEGVANRSRGQLFRGRSTNIATSAKKVCCATLHGIPGTGAIIACAGLLEAVRGAIHTFPDGRVVRPSLMLVDDFQTRESAMSASQCFTRLEVIQNDLVGLAGPDSSFCALVTCTVIRKDDAADRLLNPEITPDFCGIRRKFLLSMPSESAMRLWGEYGERRGNSLRQWGDIRDATAFYVANRAAMDDGAESSWPARFQADKGEVSAVQHAMEWYFRSRSGFWSELQNEPETEGGGGGRAWLSAVDLAQDRNVPLARGVIPRGFSSLVASVDVQGTLLYYVVMALRQDGSGHVVRYGTWPEQDVPYFTLRDAKRTLGRKYKAAGEQAALANGIADLVEWLSTHEWATEDGDTMAPDLISCDARWKTTVVREALRRSEHRRRVLAYFGQSFRAADRPIAERKYDAGSRVGLGWVLPKRKNASECRSVTADVNFWKTDLQDRLAIRLGNPGAVSFYSGVHRMYAEHLTAEFAVETQGRGRTVMEWRLRPGAENHWLDCSVAALVLGSVLGCNVPEVSEAVEAKRKRKKRRATVVEF